MLVAAEESGMIHDDRTEFLGWGSTGPAWISTTSRQAYSSRKFNFTNQLNEFIWS
jgi:hypothetical protein